MKSLHLKIDTSSAGQGSRYDGVSTPASSQVSSPLTSGPRVISPASSCSSLSIISPALSSVNATSLSSPINFIPDVRSSSSASTQTVLAPNSNWSPVSDEEHDADPDFVLAMHDYVPQHTHTHRTATCLAFQAGQIIRVLNRDSSGWWDGELDGMRGWFPSNYVTAAVNLLTEEELPSPKPSFFKPGHLHSVSTVSVTSWTSATSPKHSSFTRTDHRPSESDHLVHELDPYCPDQMVPLLHFLTVLQNVARSNRTAHFQPATAKIVTHVRSILSDTGCLSRDAICVRQFPALARERKRVLLDLLALVAQTRRASEDSGDGNQRKIEFDAMLRLGHQVFAHLRRFLAVAGQCGIRVSDENVSAGSGTSSSGKKNGDDTLIEDDGDDDDTYKLRSPITLRTTNGTVYRPLLTTRHLEPASPRLNVRAKSLNDIRNQRTRPSPPIETARIHPSSHDSSTLGSSHPSAIGHKGGFSISSVSSSSSFDSFESVKTPGTPRFPNGPCSVAEVMEAIRHTHDQYLSTIAAFIGHAHTHSRTSHASTTGHMFELVKEVVEMVCRMLMIVDAVMNHPDIPSYKVANLKTAKQGLYNVTTLLAESVRVLTSGDVPEEKTEEQERIELLRSGTNALKAGVECVNEVKKCLTWSVGDKPIVIRLPGPGEAGAEAFTPRKLGVNGDSGGAVIAKAKSLNGLAGRYGIVELEEDMTIQAQDVFPPCHLPLNKTNDLPIGPFIPNPSSSPDEMEPSSSIHSQHENQQLSPSIISSEPDPRDTPSPVPSAPTDDDGTTWGGSQRTGRPSEDKMSCVTPSPTQNITPATRDMLSHNYSADDVAYNKDGVLVGATLDCLVEKMTPHDNIVDPAFSAVFFLTFRMFSSASDLVEAIIARYNLEPPGGLSEENLFIWQQRKGLPVRLRVANFLKLWLETYWKSATDDVALGSLMAFTRDALAVMFPHPSQRLMELIMLRSQQTDTIISARSDRLKDPGIPLNPPSSSVPSSVTDISRPIMTKALLTSLRARGFGTISILDFDALELARQMTIMESRLYCAITAEEILETGKEGPRSTPVWNVNVKAVTTLSTVITGWVAESILNEADAKKRTALVKFFIKLSERCNSMNNFSTPRAILAALDSSTISRLRQTWTGLSQKYKAQLEDLRKLADHARNYSAYRGRLRNTSPPAVPFLGLYLTDVTFCREGNPSQRPSPLSPEKKLINFNKYHKLARIVQDMQRFQMCYNYKEIPEVQDYLQFVFEKSKRQGDIQDLYRRSLLIEPKQPADLPPTNANDVRQLFGWVSRSSSTTTPTSA